MTEPDELGYPLMTTWSRAPELTPESRAALNRLLADDTSLCSYPVLTTLTDDELDVLRAELAHLWEFVRFCAVGKRPDGTYNYEREAIEQRAKALLEGSADD